MKKRHPAKKRSVSSRPLVPKKNPKLKSALKEDPTARLQKLSPTALSQVSYDLRTIMYWWFGDPTEDRILEIRRTVPLLDELLDFPIVLSRLGDLNVFERSALGVSIDRFLPELNTIYKAAVKIIHGFPNGVTKAENWLLPIARQAGADSDVEASVYFASRGHKDLIDVDALRKSWYRTICGDIERGKPVGKVPSSILTRAKEGTISLSEAASLLTFNGELFRFAAFRDEEEDFIDASIFRAVEWLGITGFEPWLKSTLSELSAGPQGGIDHARASWWLFFWCRSDRALKMADRHGLESWPWALINGPIDREKPWKVFQSHPEQQISYRDYLPLTGALLFIWERILPQNMKDDVITAGIELLFQTQMLSGAWPLFSDAVEPCLITTCYAIHGLVAKKPSGWQNAVQKAAK